MVKVAGQRSMSSRVSATLTLPQWRALAAVLDVAINISDDPVRTSILHVIYTDLARQLNFELQPVMEEPDATVAVEE